MFERDLTIDRILSVRKLVQPFFDRLFNRDFLQDDAPGSNNTI